MYSRPKKSENEEDLLKLQDEYYNKSKRHEDFKPAARTVGPEINPFTGPHEKSTEAESSSEHIRMISNTFEDIPKVINIGEIRAKTYLGASINGPVKITNKTGFPAVKRRESSVYSKTGSIFSQQMKKQRGGSSPEPCSSAMDTGTPENDNKPSNIPTESCILTGKDSTDLHAQNVDVMSRMTEEEILEERQRLMSTLDPAIIAFLKSKRHHNETAAATARESDIQIQNKTEISIDTVLATKMLVETATAQDWLHFDKVETRKLAWMTEVDVPELVKNEEYEARFDFDGFLLPYLQEEVTEKSRSLYHHGEEPSRPGYTLQELFQLCRSSVQQQKIVALNAIANILSMHASGVYDNIIDLPLEQILFVLRFCVDDNVPSVLNPAVRAVRHLVYFPLDETCCDNVRSFGDFIQPVLAVNESDFSDDNTVNDQQLAELDLVKCLVRSGILTRIRYILSTIKPAQETIIYCLQILIRLARDSHFVLARIYDEHKLLDVLINDFFCFKNGTPLAVLTLLVKIFSILYSRCSSIDGPPAGFQSVILSSIKYYLLTDSITNTNEGVLLQTECLHFCRIAMHCRLDFEGFCEIADATVKHIYYHIDNTDANCSSTYTMQSHAAANLIYIMHFIDHSNASPEKFMPVIKLATTKWVYQFAALENYTCGKLQIIASVFSLASRILTLKSDLFNDEHQFQTMIASRGFRIVTEHLCESSNILNNFETHKTSANLITVEAAAWNNSEHALPILQTASAIPLLSSFAECVRAFSNPDVSIAFLIHPHIARYIAKVNAADKYHLTSNWFTRIETSDSTGDDGMMPFLSLAVRSLPLFHHTQRHRVRSVLDNLVFNSACYPLEASMQSLEMTDKNPVLLSADMLAVYENVLNLKQIPLNFASKLSGSVCVGNFIPTDWIYSPILVLLR